MTDVVQNRTVALHCSACSKTCGRNWLVAHPFASDGRSMSLKACHEHPASRRETGRGRLSPMPAAMVMSHNQPRIGEERGEKA